MSLIKIYSVDINITVDMCGFSFLLIDAKYSGKICILMTIYGSFFEIAYTVIYEIPRTRNFIQPHPSKRLTLHDIGNDSFAFYAASQPRVLRISNEFLSEGHISNVNYDIPGVCTKATYYLKAM